MGDPFVRPGVPCETYDLVLRHPGTGTSDTSAHEWMTNIHRDTFASIADHYDRALYLSIAENVCVARTRQSLLESIADPEPCGPAPKRWRDELVDESAVEEADRKHRDRNRIDIEDIDPQPERRFFAPRESLGTEGYYYQS